MPDNYQNTILAVIRDTEEMLDRLQRMRASVQQTIDESRAQLYHSRELIRRIDALTGTTAGDQHGACAAANAGVDDKARTITAS